METIIISSLIILFTFLNSLNFIVGAFAVKKGEFFLGTVHWAGDYFYYLSQFAQGKYSWVSGFDLYTGDSPQRTYVGWVNVFLGHIFHLFGINQIAAYQISVALFTLAFLGLSYLLIREIFQKEKIHRIIAFILFLTTNAFPKIAIDHGKWSFSYFDFWFNNGLPFNRLVGVPHQMIGKTMLVLSLLLIIGWVKGRRNVWVLVGTVLTSIVLVSVEPVHWVMVVIISFFLPIIIYGSPPASLREALRAGCRSLRLPASWQVTQGKRVISCSSRLPRKVRSTFVGLASPVDKSKVINFIGLLGYWVIGLIILISGLPMAIYLKKLFLFPPYSQLAAWEMIQQQHVDLWGLITGFGPVTILAVIGIVSFLKKISDAKLLALVFTVFSLGLFFSPIPWIVGIVNVRFLPVTVILFFSCYGSSAIVAIAKRFAKFENLIIGILVTLFIAITIPAFNLQIRSRLTLEKNNSYYFVPQTVMDTYKEAENISTPNDVFLVIWPFNSSFPGITARRVYQGHQLLTIDSKRKDDLQFKFFDGKMNEAEMQDFLSLNKINYIVTYPWTGILNAGGLFTKVYANDFLGVYRVN